MSSLGVGSLTSLCFHSQISSNDSIIKFCVFSHVSYNYIPCFNNNFLNFYRKSGINRLPIYAQINASSSEAKVDENLDVLSPISEPHRPIQSPDWEAAKKYKETGSIYEGRVEGFNNGGLLVRFYSLVGFLPFPQLGPSYSSRQVDAEPKKTIHQIARGLIGSVIPVKVIDVHEESCKLILSEKEATWAKFSDKINVGDIFETRVHMVEDYGAFLDLRFPDGKYHLTGLVHISEVSWDFVQDVRDVLRVGDIVRAKIINIDRKKSRVTLSIRQLEEDPLLETLDKVIPQDSATSPDSTSTSESYDIQPLPGLLEIFEELLKEDGINEVKIRRQGFEKRVVSQDLQLWLSNAPAVDNRYTLLARAGRQVQEIQMTTILDQEGIKQALQRVLERVP